MSLADGITIFKPILVAGTIIRLKAVGVASTIIWWRFIICRIVSIVIGLNSRNFAYVTKYFANTLGKIGRKLIGGVTMVRNHDDWL